MTTMTMIKGSIILRLAAMGFEDLSQKTTFDEDGCRGTLTFTLKVNKDLRLVASWLGDDGETTMPAKLSENIGATALDCASTIIKALDTALSFRRNEYRASVSCTPFHAEGTEFDVLFCVVAGDTETRTHTVVAYPDTDNVSLRGPRTGNAKQTVITEDVSFYANNLQENDVAMGQAILGGAPVDSVKAYAAAMAVKGFLEAIGWYSQAPAINQVTGLPVACL